MNAEDLLKKFEPQPTDVEIDYERQLWFTRFSPCGKFLVGGGYDATVQRWDISGDPPKLLSPLTGHDGWVQCIAFQPNGELLFSADSWGRLVAWKYAEESPQPVWNLPEAHDGWIRALAVSADGQSLATGGNDCVVRIRSAADGKVTNEFEHPVRVFSICFYPDGKSLVTGDLEGIIRHWSIADGKVTRTIDASILYSHDTASERIQHCGGVRHLGFNTDATQLVCSGQKEPGGGFATGKPCAIVFNWETGERIREMEMGDTNDGFAYDAQFHPDGFVMAAACAFPGKGQVWFWQPGDEKPFFTSKKLANGRSLAVHPDGNRLAILHSISPNGNGRLLKDGKYVGGSAKIRMMRFAHAAPMEPVAAPN